MQPVQQAPLWHFPVPLRQLVPSVTAAVLQLPPEQIAVWHTGALQVLQGPPAWPQFAVLVPA